MGKTDIGIDLGTANTVITIGKKRRRSKRTFSHRISHQNKRSVGCGKTCISDDWENTELY